MRTITLRLPDDLHQGIKLLATERKVSISKLYEELSAVLLHGYDAEMRFRTRVADGSPKKGLAILDKLDKHYVENRK
ncbi:MAG TPA: toxin-antitoxin system HicB family antitoxin [Deltaproteobacteria bacterium]|nr:toxin-antitoxin system HicB family antitoxin [Deltaproteobacteria bacterium]